METETRELVEKLFVVFVIGPAAVYLVMRYRDHWGRFLDWVWDKIVGSW